MSTPIKDGGPAFPNRIDTIEDGEIIPVEYRGMSLHDWFAGQALAGLASHEASWLCSAPVIAERAHTLAEAMIKARESGQ